MSDILCVAEHRDTPPLPADGLAICEWHWDRLLADLAYINAHWHELVALMQPGRTGGGGGKRDGVPSPCRDDIVAVTDPRSAITDDLWPVAGCIGEWVRDIAQGRGFSRTPVDVAAAARWLQHNAEWPAANGAAPVFVAEMHSCAWQIRRLTGDLPPRPIGTCNAQTDDGRACGGAMRYDGHAAVCSRCGDAWGPLDILHIGRVIPLQLWAPVSWVADMLDIPARTLRHWVAVGKVRKDQHGQVLHAAVWEQRHAVAGVVVDA